MIFIPKKSEFLEISKLKRDSFTRGVTVPFSDQCFSKSFAMEAIWSMT